MFEYLSKKDFIVFAIFALFVSPVFYVVCSEEFFSTLFLTLVFYLILLYIKNTKIKRYINHLKFVADINAEAIVSKLKDKD